MNTTSIFKYFLEMRKLSEALRKNKVFKRKVQKISGAYYVSVGAFVDNIGEKNTVYILKVDENTLLLKFVKE